MWLQSLIIQCQRQRDRLQSYIKVHNSLHTMIQYAILYAFLWQAFLGGADNAVRNYQPQMNANGRRYQQAAFIVKALP